MRGACGTLRDNEAAMSHALALVMIVRNEARCLARCLDSARPWVDDIVVLDTGSTDATREIAASAGARVLSAAWPDDFSAARNLALSHTAAPWRLVLDADEWIASGGECLVALREREPGFIGLVQVSSEIDDGSGQRQRAPSWLPRVLPAGVHYEGRIHEQPVGVARRERLPLVIGHDGYLAAAQQAKAGRNERLLRLALAEQPGDAYLVYQLGKDLEVRSRFAEALPLYRQALREGDTAAAWRHDLVVRLLFTLKKQRCFAEAITLAGEQMERWQDSPDFFFTLGDLLLDWALAEPARAGELLPQIEASWQRAVAIGERPELPDSVRGRGSWLAAHNLAAFHQSLGQADQATLWRERAAQWRAAAGLTV